MGKLEIKYVNIKDIVPYDKNPRHNEEAIPYVMKSIEKFGFKNPIIIDKNNIIVCGHTRLESAKRLNMSEVPCIMADDLTDEQIKAFRLADNKVGEIATWDFDLLNIELENILDIDMNDFGFENIDNIEFDEENLDDEREKQKISVSVVFNNYEDYEKVKERLEELTDEVNANLSIKMI